MAAQKWWNAASKEKTAYLLPLRVQEQIYGVDDFAYPLTPNAAGLSEGTVELWISADNWGW